jgi:hypothetical protein
MKYLNLLLAVGCLAFSPAHADTVTSYAQTKSQAQGRYLSAFWEQAQLSQAVVDVFSDSAKTLVIDESGAAVGFSRVSRNVVKEFVNHQIVVNAKLD